MKPIVLLAILLLRTAIVRGQDDSSASTMDSTAGMLEIAAETDEEPEPAVRTDNETRISWSVSSRYALERRSGFRRTDSSAFAGPPIALRSRLRARLGAHILAVLTMDQDAGEALTPSIQPFDFVSSSIAISSVGPFRSIIVGDIRPRFGLGLSVWTGRRMARPATQPTAFLRPNASVRPGGSTYEATRLRGSAADVEIADRLHISVFAARTTNDASVNTDGLVTSLPTSGYHRTATEHAHDDRLKGSAAGAALVYDARTASIGISYLRASRDSPLAPSSRPYLRHRFNGRSWQSGSLFGRFDLDKRVRVAGELALDHDGTPAGLVTSRTTIGGVRLYLVWRDYPGRYSTPFGAPPGATGTLGNERGWTAGLEAKARLGRIRLSRDLYRKPWLQHDSFRPSTIDAWSLSGEGRFERVRWLVRCDARRSNRKPMPGAAGAAPFAQRTRLRARFVLDREVLKPSFDIVIVRAEGETGEGIGQRLTWSSGVRTGVTMGIVFFRSDSGNSGVYLYEPDLPDYLTVPLLVGAGRRAYVVAQLAFSDAVSGWLKAVLTHFTEERTIGSGVDAIKASSLRTIAAAVRVAL